MEGNTCVKERDINCWEKGVEPNIKEAMLFNFYLTYKLTPYSHPLTNNYEITLHFVYKCEIVLERCISNDRSTSRATNDVCLYLFDWDSL